MRVDGKVRVSGFDDVRRQVRASEDAGYDGIIVGESAHDPFLPALLVAEHSERLDVSTSIAVAFGRTPMALAYIAHDLNTYSQGRFHLGLGTQVKPHIERRFGMPWSAPARRMREYVQALHAIWDSWETGAPLDFRGEFYSHTLMTPFFSPPSEGFRLPPIHVAAVGEQLTTVASEVGDGLIAHAFTTVRYLREVTLPRVEAGLAASGRARADFTVSIPAMIATGRTEEEMATSVRKTRDQIGFYGSTGAYRGVLDLHGWGALADELNRLSRTGDPGRWQQLGELVDDEVLHTIAVVAEPAGVAKALHERFDGLVDRLSFYPPYDIDVDVWTPVVAELKAM